MRVPMKEFCTSESALGHDINCKVSALKFIYWGWNKRTENKKKKKLKWKWRENCEVFLS